MRVRWWPDFAALRSRMAAVVVLLAVAGAPASAQDAPIDAPKAGAVLQDDEFRVTTREFGLERRVEMYQWRRDGDRYVTTWNAARIDSSDFAPGHDNPPMPLQGMRWWAREATLDGRPLDADVLRILGQWRTFRPGFSRLPGNLAATFQPEGDGLGSAENPLDPQVGDLRVSWRELVLPPLAGRVELRDGVWRPTRAAAAEAIEPMPSNPAPGAADAGVTPRLWPWLLAIGALVVALYLARRRRHRRARNRRVDPPQQ